VGAVGVLSSTTGSSFLGSSFLQAPKVINEIAASVNSIFSWHQI